MALGYKGMLIQRERVEAQSDLSKVKEEILSDQ